MDHNAIKKRKVKIIYQDVRLKRLVWLAFQYFFKEVQNCF